MPSDELTTGDELQLDVIPETEVLEDTQSTTGEGESEENGVTLNLESEDAQVDKRTPAEINAQKQEDAWLTKVTTGKANVEDAPQWLHARLNARLEATNNVPETEEVVKKVLEQEREAQEFKNLQAQIPQLTEAQAKELQERFNTLKPAGKVVALKAAMDAMGLSQAVKEAEARGIAKGRISLPVSGQPPVRRTEQIIGGVPADVITDDKKWREMIRQGI